MEKHLIREIQEELRIKLKGNRFEHTLGVQYTSVCLAMKYGCNLKKAELAGLLHDCAKQIAEKDMVELCEKYGEDISDFEYKHPFLLHGKAGACLAKMTYDIKDEEILNAIRNHTTGRENMSLLEQIVFVADYIEPGRKEAKNLEFLRKIAFEDLDLATLKILEQTLEYLEQTGASVDQRTVVTRDFYKELLRSKVHE